MLQDIKTMNDGWIKIIKKKDKQIIKKQKLYELINPLNKPNKFSKVIFKNITNADYTLTSDEKELLENEQRKNPSLEIFNIFV